MLFASAMVEIMLITPSYLTSSSRFQSSSIDTLSPTEMELRSDSSTSASIRIAPAGYIVATAMPSATCALAVTFIDATLPSTGAVIALPVAIRPSNVPSTVSNSRSPRFTSSPSLTAMLTIEPDAALTAMESARASSPRPMRLEDLWRSVRNMLTVSPGINSPSYTSTV